jgi:hypothetical protein
MRDSRAMPDNEIPMNVPWQFSRMESSVGLGLAPSVVEHMGEAMKVRVGTGALRNPKSKKCDIVDTTFHASWATGPNMTKQMTLPILWQGKGTLGDEKIGGHQSSLGQYLPLTICKCSGTLGDEGLKDMSFFSWSVLAFDYLRS